MYDEINITPYMAAQMELEEKYYDELMAIYLILLSLLADNLKNNANKYGLMKLFNSWWDQYDNRLQLINTKYATEMFNLVNKHALNNEIDVNKPTAVLIIDFIRQDLKENQGFLNHSIAGRFVTAIPTGAILITGLASAFIPEDEAIEDLITRGTNSVKKFVQFNVSQGVGDLIASMAGLDGYNEYLAGNEQDDKVRVLHREQNNFKTWHRFDNPPSTGLPGTEPNCRCEILKIRKTK